MKMTRNPIAKAVRALRPQIVPNKKKDMKPALSKPWDTADHLKTEEARELFLKACAEEFSDDIQFMEEARNTVERSRLMYPGGDDERR